MPGKFQGFPKASFDFLADLKANNSREWFEDNRHRYDAHWKTPALDLIDTLAEPMSQLDPPLKAESRINGSLRRINRDVRFSKDKSPYNARMHLIFWSGSHPNRSAAFHFVLSPSGMGYGAGVFGLDSKTLRALRDRIIDPKDRANLFAAITQAQTCGSEFDEPDLKRLPSGYQADDNWEHLLRRKAFVMRTLGAPTNPTWLGTDQCATGIMEIARAHMPLVHWLSQ